MGKHRRSESRSRSRSRSKSRSRDRKHKKEKKHKKDKKRDKSDRRKDDLLPLPQNSYTDMNNPFNDPSLSSTFIWGKKLKVEGKDNLSTKAIERMNRERIHQNLEEMDKLKRERDARQSAREDIEMIAREDDKRQHTEWKRVESAFHLNQAEMRSKIRIKEGRPMPIDLLMRFITYGEPNEDNKRNDYEDFELERPVKYIKNLSAEQFEDLIEDIKVSRLLFKGKYQEFWDDITTLAKSELKKLSNDRAEENIHSSVMNEVTAKFEKKSFAELKDMEKDIVNQIKSRSRGIDVSFWEEVLDLLHPKMARTRLSELYTKKAKMRIELIKAEQRRATEMHEKEHNITLPSTSKKESSTADEMDSKPDTRLMNNTLDKEDMDVMQAYDMSRPLPFTMSELEILDDEQKEQKWSQLNDGQLNRFVVEVYNAGGYSPKYLNESRIMPGIDVLDEVEDANKLKEMRANKGKPSGDSLSANEAKMMEIAKLGMGGDESTFSVEENLGQQTMLWSDKFRPQKPKYFNRVHTGFDWNKYNQTHYDVDNPPPKVVQGYRFNIFYPDLLDITKTPSFTLTNCNNDPDFAILRFRAGPPYEDVAFKIVNREWEVNHKNGYKCQFSNNVFQLWFYFKRYRYRR